MATEQGFTADPGLMVRQADVIADLAEVLWQLTRSVAAAKPETGWFGRLPASMSTQTAAAQAATAASDRFRELSIAVDHTSDGVTGSALNYRAGDRDAAQGFQSLLPGGGELGEPARVPLTPEQFVRFSGESRREAGVGLVLRGGREFIHIVPRDSSVPIIDIPNTVDATGFDAWHDPRAHVYDALTPTDLPFDKAREAAGKELATHPTPWQVDTATQDGTPNNALPFGTGEVRSFTVASPDPARYSDIVVNYTTKNHILDEGYVVRFGQLGPDGTLLLRSYGEGNAVLQDMLGGPADWAAEKTWKINQDGIAERLHDSVGRVRDGR